MNSMGIFDRMMKDVYASSLKRAMEQPWELEIMRLQAEIKRLEKKVERQKAKLMRAGRKISHIRRCPRYTTHYDELVEDPQGDFVLYADIVEEEKTCQ